MQNLKNNCKLLKKIQKNLKLIIIIKKKIYNYKYNIKKLTVVMRKLR